MLKIDQNSKFSKDLSKSLLPAFLSLQYKPQIARNTPRIFRTSRTSTRTRKLNSINNRISITRQIRLISDRLARTFIIASFIYFVVVWGFIAAVESCHQNEIYTQVVVVLRRGYFEIVRVCEGCWELKAVLSVESCHSYHSCEIQHISPVEVLQIILLPKSIHLQAIILKFTNFLPIHRPNIVQQNTNLQ